MAAIREGQQSNGTLTKVLLALLIAMIGLCGVLGGMVANQPAIPREEYNATTIAITDRLRSLEVRVESVRIELSTKLDKVLLETRKP